MITMCPLTKKPIGMKLSNRDILQVLIICVLIENDVDNCCKKYWMITTTEILIRKDRFWNWMNSSNILSKGTRSEMMMITRMMTMMMTAMIRTETRRMMMMMTNTLWQDERYQPYKSRQQDRSKCGPR